MAILSVAATLYVDGARAYQGTLDQCLDHYQALDTAPRALASLTADGDLPGGGTKLSWPMSASDIERALEMRALGDLV